MFSCPQKMKPTFFPDNNGESNDDNRLQDIP